MGISPTMYYEKCKLGFLWFLKSLQPDRWAYQALLEQEKWLQNETRMEFWLQNVMGILNKHGIPYEACWSKSEHKHYWTTLHKRVYELIENGNFLTNYNKFTEYQWLLAICGGLKWFNVEFDCCPACGGDPHGPAMSISLPMNNH